MPDVSQFIQMQRLRSIAARRTAAGDKSLSRLSQSQLGTSGIAKFLPNPATKNTIVRNSRFPASQGLHSKAKIPGGYVFGNSPVIPPLPEISLSYDGGIPTQPPSSDVLDGGPVVNNPPFSKTADGGRLPSSPSPPPASTANGGTPSSNNPADTFFGGTPADLAPARTANGGTPY
jgi:hypothetical protein